MGKIYMRKSTEPYSYSSCKLVEDNNLTIEKLFTMLNVDEGFSSIDISTVDFAVREIMGGELQLGDILIIFVHNDDEWR